jgi:hypothetical protein
MNDNEFSVCQFFEDKSYEYFKRFVGAKEAVEAAHFLSHNVAAKMGITRRVIITDGGDQCVFEWKHGEGVTFPTPAERRESAQS